MIQQGYLRKLATTRSGVLFWGLQFIFCLSLLFTLIQINKYKMDRGKKKKYLVNVFKGRCCSKKTRRGLTTLIFCFSWGGVPWWSRQSRVNILSVGSKFILGCLNFTYTLIPSIKHYPVQRKGTTSIRQTQSNNIFHIITFILPSFSPIWQQTLVTHFHWAQDMMSSSRRILLQIWAMGQEDNMLTPCTTLQLYHLAPSSEWCWCHCCCRKVCRKSSHLVPGTKN